MSRKLQLVIVGLVVGSVVGASGAWLDDQWVYRQKITLHSSQVPGDLTNFPVLITEANVQAALFANAQADGDDIALTAVDGTTRLSHEFETYDAGAQELDLWVKIPLLSGSTDTDIYVYYGNASAGDQQDAENVWDTNYLAVYHLSETNGPQYDSTANSYDLTAYGAGTTQGVEGVIDGADSFAGTDNTDYLLSPSPGVAYVDGEDRTYEMFFKANFPTADFVNDTRLLANKSTTVSRGVLLFTYKTDRNWVALQVIVGGAWLSSWTTTPMTTGTWYHIAATYEFNTNGYFNSDLNVFLDGSHDSVDSGWSMNQPSLSWLSIAGDTAGGANEFPGCIDEVRVSDNVRSADWIAAGYNNQTAPGSFASPSAESTQTLSGTLVLIK